MATLKKSTAKSLAKFMENLQPSNYEGLPLYEINKDLGTVVTDVVLEPTKDGDRLFFRAPKLGKRIVSMNSMLAADVEDNDEGIYEEGAEFKAEICMRTPIQGLDIDAVKEKYQADNPQAVKNYIKALETPEKGIPQIVIVE